jgi:hypothetical protein
MMTHALIVAFYSYCCAAIGGIEPFQNEFKNFECNDIGLILKWLYSTNCCTTI